jgi:hypothetical protein
MNVVKKSKHTEKWRSFHSDCSRICQYYDALLSGEVCNYLFMIYLAELSALQFIQRRMATWLMEPWIGRDMEGSYGGLAKVLSTHFPGMTEVSGPRFEPETP